MSKSKILTGTYWLAVVERLTDATILETVSGYKTCSRPGSYRVMLGPDGPVCPGCDRVCRIPATSGLVRGDAIIVCGKKVLAKELYA
ncbi:MAG: hypothetical protein AB7U59_13820 [Desulfovibrionaceae bacterium]